MRLGWLSLLEGIPRARAARKISYSLYDSTRYQTNSMVLGQHAAWWN